MTTQVQIEAAAKVLAEAYNGGEWDNPIFYKEHQKEMWRGFTSKALTAAAKVEDSAIGAMTLMEMLRLQSATIERCAEWLEANDQPVLAENLRVAMKESQ